MATSTFTCDAAEFVTNNYYAILENESVHTVFHMIQDLLKVSKVGFSLTNPPMISGAQLL